MRKSIHSLNQEHEVFRLWLLTLLLPARESEGVSYFKVLIQAPMTWGPNWAQDKNVISSDKEVAGGGL